MREANGLEDVVIIGSGPAGLTAAIYTARANLNPLMIEGEEVGGQLMTTNDVENFPGFPQGITGPELIQNLRQQAERFGTRFITQNVSHIDLTDRPFKIQMNKETIKSRALIIATGASAKYLGLESEKKFLGRGVSACATCDGAFFKNVDVAVVGGGDTAMEEASFLTRFARKVWIIHRRDSFRASKIMVDRVLKNPKIEVLWNTELKEILGDQVANSIRCWNNQKKEEFKLPMDGVFLAIGHQPNTAIFKGQLAMNETGYLITQSHSTYTSVNGVFAAGDVQDHVYRQAITAAGTGCMAAIDCERWLEAQGEHF